MRSVPLALCSFGTLTRTASTSRALSALQRHEVFHDLRGVGKRHLIEGPVLQVGVDVPYVQAERPAYLRGRHALSQLLFPTPLPPKALGSSPAFRLGICRKKRVDELRIFTRKILPRLAQTPHISPINRFQSRRHASILIFELTGPKKAADQVRLLLCMRVQQQRLFQARVLPLR